MLVTMIKLNHQHGLCRNNGCSPHPITLRMMLLLWSTIIIMTTTMITASSSSSTTDMTGSTSSCSSSGTKSNGRILSLSRSIPYVKPTTWLPQFIYDESLVSSSGESSSNPTMKWKDVMVPMKIADDDKHQDEECINTNNGDDEILSTSFPALHNAVIGTMPQFDNDHTIRVLNDAVNNGWKGGSGIWPQMNIKQRIECIELFIENLLLKRNDIIEILMWEIAKNINDATAEFDRTISFIKQLIVTIKNDPELYGTTTNPSTGNTYYMKRNPIGIVVCLAPYNYPINESYATIIPSLLMGNIVIVKIPTIGGLAHLLTMEAFAKSLPTGTIHFVAGTGRTTMPILLQTGQIDALAFIGSKNAANQLIHIHPNPHRLKVFLQLEAKNMAIILPNIFIANDKVYDNTMKEIITGTLSYNGQRCTALKLIFVPTLYVNQFIDKFIEMIHHLPVGLPWQNHNTNTDDNELMIQSMVTPLPSMDRIHYMKELIEDALLKGATIVNEKYGGGKILGGINSTLMIPAILYPVTPSMKIYYEEQFGPIIPIVSYDNPETIIQYGQNGVYGQQVSIFTDPNANNDDDDNDTITKYIDIFSTIFGKININSQCSRSPDTLPFSGRRSSAMGIMSIKHSLYEFSIPTVISYKNQIVTNNNDKNNDILWQHIQDKSIFLQPL